MTAGIISRSPVTQGLWAMLTTALLGGGGSGRDLKIGKGAAPTDLLYDAQNRLVDPYAIIYSRGMRNVYGTLGLPESGGTLAYQITSVGRTDISAEVIGDKIRHYVTQRGPNGQFVNTINTGSEVSIVQRQCMEIGMAEPQAGVWQSVSLYELEVQANG